LSLSKYNYTASLGSPGHLSSAISPLADKSRIPYDSVLSTAFVSRIRRALRDPSCIVLVTDIGTCHSNMLVSREKTGLVQ